MRCKATLSNYWLDRAEEIDFPIEVSLQHLIFNDLVMEQIVGRVSAGFL